MLVRRILFSTAACLIASALFADEPECATNYKSGASSAETSVVTVLTPKEVIESLPRKLADAGASMEWAEPAKGILKAGSLDVKAAVSGGVTHVTFHSSAAADKATLCRYASLVGNPLLPPPPPVSQDPALIAQMKEDLLRKHQIVQPGIGGGLNNVMFRSLEDFLAFTIAGTKELSNQREYNVSMLLPRLACAIASEEIDDSALVMAGQTPTPHTKPVRADATLIYVRNGGDWKLTDAFIRHIESTK
jgi:hypothetical protein